MANLNAYPIDDVSKMAELAGYSVFEIEEFWTDQLLAANMGFFYDGTLAPIVNPAQAIRPEDVSVASLFAEGASADITSALSQVADTTKNIGSALLSGTESIGALIKSLPLLAVVAAGIGVYLLVRKG